METFAMRLKLALAYKGMSRKELCEKAPVSTASLGNYFNCRAVPTITTAYAIAKALDVPLGWLCGDGTLEEVIG